MFTGIIEEIGEVVSRNALGANLDLAISAKMAAELRVDQSVAHNGVCLTVVKIEGDRLTLSPCIPKDWREFQLSYRYKGTEYQFNVTSTLSSDFRMEVDGQLMNGKSLQLANDGSKHIVTLKV